MSWVEEELKYADLGDKRRNKRLVTIVEDLALQPNASVTQAVRDKAALQGIYDFWSNRRIKAEHILEAHTASTRERVSTLNQVLLIQDTTELDYSQHHKKDIGPLSGKGSKGLKVHSTLCASLDGVPMGLIDQKVWARETIRRTKGYDKRKAALLERESQRWLESLENSLQKLPESVRAITVADREADIFRFLTLHQELEADFLIRACQNRRTVADVVKPGQKTQSLWEVARNLPIKGYTTITLQRTPRRKAPRQVELAIRYGSVCLQAPQSTPSEAPQHRLKVQVIFAEEVNPPAKEKPVVWLLLTSLEVENEEQAKDCLKLYTYRWLIERYHYTLKSGCNLEKLQLEKADRIHRALATYSIVAWRLLWLIYEAREDPEQPATVALGEDEWRSLYCTIHKDAIAQTTQLPETPPTLRSCIRWIAQLGGFLGRKGDGEPGVKTLWRGMQRLNDISATWTMVLSLMTALDDLSLLEEIGSWMSAIVGESSATSCPPVNT